MEVGAIKEALDLIIAENTELKRQNEELTGKLGAIAKTLNGSFTPAHAEILAKGDIEVTEPVMNPSGGRGKRIDQATRKAIGAAYAKQKKPVKEIVADFNVSPYTVYTTLKRLGIPVRG